MLTLLSAESSHDCHAYPSHDGKEHRHSDLYGEQEQDIVACGGFWVCDQDEQPIGYGGGDELCDGGWRCQSWWVGCSPTVLYPTPQPNAPPILKQCKKPLPEPLNRKTCATGARNWMVTQ